MWEGDRFGDQKEAGEVEGVGKVVVVFVVSVAMVADDGVPQVGHVAPELMGPAGFGDELHKGESCCRVASNLGLKLDRFNALIMGEGLFGLRISFWFLPFTVVGRLDRMVNAPRWVDPATRKGLISFLDPLL